MVHAKNYETPSAFVRDRKLVASFFPDTGYSAVNGTIVSYGSYVTSPSSLTGLASLVCHGSYIISLTQVLRH